MSSHSPHIALSARVHGTFNSDTDRAADVPTVAAESKLVATCGCTAMRPERTCAAARPAGGCDGLVLRREGMGGVSLGILVS